MRTCKKCQERPATNVVGAARCDECRLPDPSDGRRQRARDRNRVCRRCGGPPVNAGGPPVCAEHQFDTLNRPLIERTCIVCGKEYTTKGGNRTCPMCLHHARKHPCPDCGVQVDKRAEVCRQCWGKRHRGEQSAVWKGGRVTSRSNGYVQVKVPGHPAAGAAGYVREHILVMEKMIGRYLLPGENVHHRNGVRDDNRPANLELWLIAQPAGQRAIDLLAWAREIVAMYEPVEQRLGGENELRLESRRQLHSMYPRRFCPSCGRDISCWVDKVTGAVTRIRPHTDPEKRIACPGDPALAG